MSILDLPLAETPIAVIDLETTGLSATSDRIVEIAVARVDPGEAPRLVLDTLVDPQRRVTCSEIHGIYDEDVEGAPLFRELLDPLTRAVDGAVVGAFNVYFDIKFLEAELAPAKVPLPLPHLCLMWLRPALGLGSRASLEATCQAIGVPADLSHRAATDAMASAALWPHYVRAAESLGIRTFRDLAAHKSYKFTASWDAAALARDRVAARPSTTALKPRRDRNERDRREARTRDWIERRPGPSAEAALQGVPDRYEPTNFDRDPLPPRATPVEPRAAIGGVAAYWQALTAAIVDQEVTAAELAELRRLQGSPQLTPPRLRWVHARVFSGLLDEFSADKVISDAEVAWLAHVHQVLGELGWAPGQGGAPASSSPPTPRERIQLLPPESPSWWSRLFG